MGGLRPISSDLRCPPPTFWCTSKTIEFQRRLRMPSRLRPITFREIVAALPQDRTRSISDCQNRVG